MDLSCGPFEKLLYGLLFQMVWGHEFRAISPEYTTKIEEYTNCVTVRFRPAGYVPSQRTGIGFAERQKIILDLLERTQEGMAIREIISYLLLDTGSRQVRRGLKALRERGLAKPEGHGMAARWKRT
jgi:hypothetical protein